MPIPPYEGHTCVAFLDISGFKKMLKKTGKAQQALNKFYNSIYRLIDEFNQNSNIPVRSLVVSDCAIIFVDNQYKPKNSIRDLHLILNFVREINRRLISSVNTPIMTKCSIAYGEFNYRDRAENAGTAKDFFYGQAYVDAFLDNETLKQPGFCRVIRKQFRISSKRIRNDPFSLLEKQNGHYYFFWMLNNLEKLTEFKSNYDEVNEAVFRKMENILREYSNQ